MLSPLEGFVVGVTADRRADEQADLLVRRGARVLHGPVIRTLPLGPDDDLRDATAQVIECQPDYVIANTGIGIRGWVTAAAAWGWDEPLTAALGTARVLARGPKAAGALHALGVDVWWPAPRGRHAGGQRGDPRRRRPRDRDSGLPLATAGRTGRPVRAHRSCLQRRRRRSDVHHRAGGREPPRARTRAPPGDSGAGRAERACSRDGDWPLLRQRGAESGAR